MLLLCQHAFGQKKLIQQLIERFLSNKVDTVRKSSIVPIPVLTYAQETGLVFGAGAMYSFYADKNDRSNRSSNVYIAASASTRKQFSFSYNGDFWTKNNDIHLITIAQYRKFTNNFYGIGNDTRRIDADELLQNQLKTSVEIEKKIAPNVYLGPTFAFENYRFESQTNSPTWQNPNLIGKNGGKVFYLGLASSFDSRNDNNYPTKGMYHRLTVQYAPDFFKGDNYTGFQVKLNARAYHAITPKLVLAGNLQAGTITGNQVPFYLLQPLGGEVIMRAYYVGRFRDQNLLASQAELRYRFMNLFSVVAFGGTGQVFDQKFAFSNFKPNYGLGVRYFFDINKGLNVRLDYGFGQKLPGEPRFTGFYFSMGEAF